MAIRRYQLPDLGNGGTPPRIVYPYNQPEEDYLSGLVNPPSPDFAPEQAQALPPGAPDWLVQLAQSLSNVGPYQPNRFEGGGSRFAGGLLSGLAHGFSAPVLAAQQKREALQEQ